MHKDYCYQCLDTGIITIPMKGANEKTYDYMFQCSCRRGSYHSQLPQIDIQVAENRDFLKRLAEKNYKFLSEGVGIRFNESKNSNDE